MDNSYIRKIHPELTKNIDDTFLKKVKSVVVKNHEDGLGGIGFVMLAKDIDADLLKSFYEKNGIKIAKNLNKLITLMTLKHSNSTILLGLPGQGKYVDRSAVWITSNNKKAMEFFGIEENSGSGLFFEMARIDYSVSEDRFVGYKKYNKKDKSLYINHIYTLDHDMKSTFVYEQKCMHDVYSESLFNDMYNIIDNLPKEKLNFKSYNRADSKRTGLYISKNRLLS